MSDLCFVDTNVLVYARDATEPRKQPMAARWMEELWRAQTGRTSYQVLQEFYVTVTRKLSPGLSTQQARSEVRALSAWRPRPVDRETIERAWAVIDRFGLSFWDALIVSSAQTQECTYLLTEDLQDRMKFENLEVRNPFGATPPGAPWPGEGY